MVTEVTFGDGADKRVLVASFGTLGGANVAAVKLGDLEKQGKLDVDNTVTVTKNAWDKVEFKDFSDMTVGRGAKIGALVGGVLGLIFPPSILATAALGGAVGGMTAKLRESGFDHSTLQAMAESMEPGTSMLVTVVERQWADEAADALKGDAHKIAWADMINPPAGEGTLN